MMTATIIYAKVLPGEYFGPNNNMYFEAKFGINIIKGGYTTGIITGYGNYKQVYAQCGKNIYDGSYSGVFPPNELRVEHTDYGPYNCPYSDVYPIWW